MFLQAVVLAAAAGVAALGLVVTVGTVVRQTFLPPSAATIAPMDARLMLLTVLICTAVALLFGWCPPG